MKLRSVFCSFPLLLVLFAFHMFGIASPGFGADESKSPTLKGEVTTGRRAPNNARDERTQSQDPFRDDSSTPSTPSSSSSSSSSSFSGSNSNSNSQSDANHPGTRRRQPLPVNVHEQPQRRTGLNEVLERKANALLKRSNAKADVKNRQGVVAPKKGSIDVNQRQGVVAPKKSSIDVNRRQGVVAPKKSSAIVDVNYRQGVVAERKGDLASALENYVIAVNNDPSNKELQDAVKYVELKLKRKYRALQAHGSYFNDKHDARFLLNYGVRLYSISCFKQAERLFGKAVAMDRSNPNGYFNLGVIYEHDRNLPKALEMYRKSLSLFELNGPDLAVSEQDLASDRKLNGSISKLNRQRRRYSGMMDPENGKALAQKAVNSVLQQMEGKPSDVPKWPTLGVTEPAGGRKRAAATRHVDVCDHCLILRDVEMWPS